jgi:hypothetical protein
MEQSNIMPPNGMIPNMNMNMNMNMNNMQRPQQGNMQQQMYALILAKINETKPQLGNGWQTTFDTQQRAVLVMQM